MRTPLIALAFLVLGAALFTPARAFASEAGSSAPVHEAVSKLTAEQQSALLLLISTFSAPSPAAEASPEESALEALISAVASFESAMEAGTFELEMFFSRFSEDFRHPVVGGKNGATQWIDAMAPMIMRDGRYQITVELDEVEVEMDGDLAMAYPVRVQTPIGSITLEIVAKREDDGVWRVVAVEGL